MLQYILKCWRKRSPGRPYEAVDALIFQGVNQVA